MVRESISIKRKLFHEKPMVTVDNYFVIGYVIDWDGNRGLGIIGTNARNIPPKDTDRVQDSYEEYEF